MIILGLVYPRVSNIQRIDTHSRDYVNVSYSLQDPHVKIINPNPGLSQSILHAKQTSLIDIFFIRRFWQWRRRRLPVGPARGALLHDEPVRGARILRQRHVWPSGQVLEERHQRDRGHQDFEESSFVCPTGQ